MAIRIEKALIAGLAGHRVLGFGRTLARAGMARGLEVTWVPDSGPEGRAIGVICTVILAEGPIDSPLVSVPDLAVAFTASGAARLYPTVKAGGQLLEVGEHAAAASGRDDVRKVRVPVREEAAKAELVGWEWALALGAYGAMSRMVSAEDLAGVIAEEGGDPERARQALEWGANYVRERRYMKDRYALSIFTS